jgi:lipopolysaccharide biosynthesis glycosyltransferase
VMSVDEAYLRQLAVALTSISASSSDPHRVHVLHDGVAPADRDRVQRSLSDRVQVDWIDARAAVDGRQLPAGDPRSMYFRLFLAELLPRQLDRVIYLDSDLVVRRSLRGLWEFGLGDAPIGAVRDAYMPWVVCNPNIRWRELHVLPDAPFFNSGVMLIALEQWRTQQIGAQALALLSKTSLTLDQCALNVVLKGNWSVLPPVWNVQSYHLTGDASLAFASEGPDRVDEAIGDPAIVHFTGGSFNRPWQTPCRNPRRDEWLAWLDRTAWSGWRPQPTPLLPRALGRAQRALRLVRYGGGPDLRGRAR